MNKEFLKKSKNINIDIDSDLYQFLCQHSEYNNKSIKELVETVLVEYQEKEKKMEDNNYGVFTYNEGKRKRERKWKE